MSKQNYLNNKAKQIYKKYAKAIAAYLTNNNTSNISFSVQYIPENRRISSEMLNFSYGSSTMPITIVNYSAKYDSASIREEEVNKIKNFNGIVIWGDSGYFSIGLHSEFTNPTYSIERTYPEKKIQCTIKKTGKTYIRTIPERTVVYRWYQRTAFHQVKFHKINEIQNGFEIDNKIYRSFTNVRFDDDIDELHILYNRYSKLNKVYYNFVGESKLDKVSSPYQLARLVIADGVLPNGDVNWLKNYASLGSIYNKIYRNFKSGKLEAIKLEYNNNNVKYLVVNWEYLSTVPNIQKNKPLTKAERNKLWYEKNKAKYNESRRKQK